MNHISRSNPDPCVSFTNDIVRFKCLVDTKLDLNPLFALLDRSVWSVMINPSVRRAFTRLASIDAAVHHVTYKCAHNRMHSDICGTALALLGTLLFLRPCKPYTQSPHEFMPSIQLSHLIC